jgi:hypothetical protein
MRAKALGVKVLIRRHSPLAGLVPLLRATVRKMRTRKKTERSRSDVGQKPFQIPGRRGKESTPTSTNHLFPAIIAASPFADVAGSELGTARPA